MDGQKGTDAVQALSDGPILGVDYANPTFPKLGIESLHLSELLGRVPPRHFASPQRPGFHLLMLFTSGTGEHFLDFRRVRCKAGTLVHARPGQVQQFVLGQTMQADILLFTSEFLLPVIAAAGEAASAILADDIVPEDAIDLPPEALAGIVSVMAVIKQRYNSADLSELSAKILQHLLYALLLTIRASDAGRKVALKISTHGKLFDEFRRTVEIKFTNTRNVEQYAEAIGCSTKSLRRACTLASGFSPKALIEQRLVLEAKRLLAHTGLTVEEIASRLGFTEPTNFVKFFKRHGGVRPLEFRIKFPGRASR